MTSDVVAVGSVCQVPYQTVQWVFFVDPCIVRYFVGNIVSLTSQYSSSGVIESLNALYLDLKST